MTSIMPCLWFDDRIDEAIAFYTETFRDARVHELVRHAPDKPAFTAVLELAGQKFMLLNGGPRFTFNESVSFMIDCDGQDEVDYFWNRLTSEGGEESMCAWCKDRFGLSWQVVPRQLTKALTGPDREGANRAMQAMLQMRKIDVAAIEKAYKGG